MKFISGAELNKLAKTKHQEVIIDVRSPREYRRGHLPGALNFDVRHIAENLAQMNIWRDRSVILYCRSAVRSKEAGRMLEAAGFQEVYDAPGVSQYAYDLVEEPRENLSFWQRIFG